MKIKHHEIIPNADNPFTECKLEREPYARILTDIVNTYADGFVLAINNEWGTGKTTFVKMWQQHLKNEGFQTIYFNAWENDFDSNPLIAIMSELETLSNTKNKEDFKPILEKGAVLLKNVAPALLKAVVNKYIDSEVISETIKNTAKASTKILEESIKEYSSKKKTIAEFRVELEKFVKQAGNTKPLVFIIDELDRCRPTYAVEVLEQIKHFFSVPGIVFVLSIDKKHLASSVKGFYGSDLIDSNEYLRRFIDLEYSITEPKIKEFNRYLYEYYELCDFFSLPERMSSYEIREDGHLLLKMADTLFIKSNATLRQQERVFALTRLILCSFNSKQYTFAHLLFMLIYLKVMQNEIFQKIERNELSLQKLSDLFFEITHLEEEGFNSSNMLFIEAMLIWFYNNNQEDLRDREGLYVVESFANTLSSPIKSKFEDKGFGESLARCFYDIHRSNYGHLKLEYLIKKINLTEPIKAK